MCSLEMLLAGINGRRTSHEGQCRQTSGLISWISYPPSTLRARRALRRRLEHKRTENRHHARLLSFLESNRLVNVLRAVENVDGAITVPEDDANA